MKVKFDKHGFYHPAFGRLGRGRNVNTWYTLPAVFSEQETIDIPIWDATSKPKREVGTKSVTRYKYLPQSAEILEEAAFDDMKKQLEDDGEDAPKPVKPKAASDAAEYMPTAQSKAKAQSPIERTTGKSKSLN
jgi:hypothetical protein|tara:strand:- start:1036 stop:1434 length:399 start_codon:yes stop_codon:yes gene_type:complete